MSTGFTGTEWNHTHLLTSSPPHLLTSSHYDLCLIVLLAELSGTTPLTFAEKTVEIAQYYQGVGECDHFLRPLDL